jgi:Mg-chelatase subunit ChlD
MKPAKRGYFESRLTDLLLGELTAEEAEKLRRAIAQDAELAAAYERLKETVELVRETAGGPEEKAAPVPAPLRLSDDRRQKLLAHFKAVELEKAVPKRRQFKFTVLEIAAMLAILGLLASLVSPALRLASMLGPRTLGMDEGLSQNDVLSRPSRAAQSPVYAKNNSEQPKSVPPPATPIVLPTTVEYAYDKTTAGGSGAIHTWNLDTGNQSFPGGTPGDLPRFQTVYAGATLSAAPGEPGASTLSFRDTDTQLAVNGGFAGNSSPKSVEENSYGPKFALGNDITISGKLRFIPANDSSESSKTAGTPSVNADPIDFGLASKIVGPNIPGGISPMSSSAIFLPPAEANSEAAQMSDSSVGAPDVPVGRGKTANETTSPKTEPLQVRKFHVDPNTFYQGLESVGGLDLASLMPTSSPTGGGANGGVLTIPRVSVSAATTTGGGAGEKSKLTVTQETGGNISAGETQLAKNISTRIDEIQQKLLFVERDVSTNNTRYLDAKRELAELNRMRQIVGMKLASSGTVQSASDDPDRLEKQKEDYDKKIAASQAKVDQLKKELETSESADVSPSKPKALPPVPQNEIQTSDNAFSTFSLNISDVSFKLAAASLEKDVMPEPASIRTEEFINAFDYHDPEPAAGAPVAFASERARYPFAHNRDLLRFSIKTAAAGRQAGRPLNLVLLLDNSGSMERADRVRIIQQALHVLAGQLQLQDKLSVVTFARTASLRVDGVPGSLGAEAMESLNGLTPQGGTNLEDAMNLAYATALRHYLAGGINRVVLLTDGAANLGNVDPEALKQKVEANRKQGIALDCFGIGWEGYNDDLLEVLSRNGDGRYGFINSPDEAATDFATQLAGALKVAASDVKVQVEFNPGRVVSYRQIGYAKHQLTKEQFRDNTVDAAEIAAAESGNALYTIETNPAGEGPVCTVRVRYRIPGTGDYREQEWTVPFTGSAVSLDQAGPALRLAATASAFSEWLASSPFAAEVTPDKLLNQLGNVPEVYSADARPKKLEWMIRQAKSLSGQ